MSKYAMVIDVSKCVDCRCCVIQCKDEYALNDYPPYSAAMTYRGHKWIRVEEVERGEFPKAKFASVPVPCMHCDNAPCIAAYPEAVYKRHDGIVLIDPTAPMDEGIVASCPYGTIFWNEELQIGQKCTLCVHRLEEGEEPRCVISCPAEAIFIGEESALAPLIEMGEPLHPEYGAMPRVHYIGLPKRLVAGNVYDVRADECLKDATITVRSLRTGEMWATNSDEFGDFWLEDLEPRDLIMVRFEKPGYLPRMRLAYLREDKNLGDLAMWK